ncbi:MAG: acetyl-CoA carboxylase, carboxyltransferase subunit beta [Firmicutes bacterium HGW-Firmicutes-9]|jgi:acetyl-CoA carboxylase carboxyl transferase subunit beta|nr:MAG: acetyl-CoA carboxylase, carboxyltransferase subunit beta [Firmicutes bacterium HGW-Firmicutes-9]
MNLFTETIEQVTPNIEEQSSPLDILRCTRCGRDLVSEVVLAGDATCPYCGNLFRQPAYRRIEAIVDSGSFIEIERETEAGDPLSFPGYRTKLEKERAKSKMQEGVVIGKATIKGQRTALAVMDSYFMMGSMGTVVGQKIVILAEFALCNRLPLVIFCASGGARMQEGVLSLMQMSRTTIALARHSAAGLLHVNVLTHPTTGGVTASFAMQGDITLAEPGALIGFAGPRVIEQTMRDKLPEGFQSAEYLDEHGFVDRIVERRDMRETLASLLALHNAGHIETAEQGVRR